MALASKGWVNRRLEETGGPAHPRRLEQQSSGGSSFPWSKVALGYVLDPNGDDPDEVRILACEIDRVAVAQADVKH